MSSTRYLQRIAAAIGLTIAMATCLSQSGTAQHRDGPTTYLPKAADAHILTVSKTGQPSARVIVLTQAVAIKETGPKEAVARFGEVYAFSPNFFVVHRDEPTLIEFWNLQGDDEHDFMLMDPHWAIMMELLLHKLAKTSYIFTFHQEGLFNFTCVQHQPAMNGQILVVPPVDR